MTQSARLSDTRFEPPKSTTTHRLTHGIKTQILAQRLKPHVIDSVTYIHTALSDGKRILVEGANALLLDIDFGTYPFVTSSSTTIGGVCTGLGIPPKFISNTIGVVKAYTTRVGGGPFPTEQLNVSNRYRPIPFPLPASSDDGIQEIGIHLQETGREYGTTTGRRRRCGWLDLVVLKHSCLINGYDRLNLTKLDVLDQLPDIKIGVRYLVDGKPLSGFPADLDVLEKVEVEYVVLKGWMQSIEGVTKYEGLPEACRKYVEFVEEALSVGIDWIGVGPGRESMIRRC